MSKSSASYIPEPEVYARPLGRISLVCPNCGLDCPNHKISWRRADLRCPRCKAHYQVGLGFSLDRRAAGYLAGKWNSFTANRLNPFGTAYDGVRVWGATEFACPSCHTPQQGSITSSAQLPCSTCSAVWHISAIIHRLPAVSRLKLKAPFDSLVKGLSNVRETNEPLPSPSPNPSPGATS